MQFHWLVIDGALLLAVIAWIYRRRALARIEYDRTFSAARATEGDTIEMVERIVNRKLLPVPWLRLESMMSRHLGFGRQSNLNVSSGELFQNHVSLFSMRPYRQIVRRHEVKLLRRGYYRLDSATMTAGDPLGLVRPYRQFQLSLELLVYPRAASWRELPLPNHGWLGELPVRRWLMPDPFMASGVRPYQSGDPMKSIHWSATARTGELQVHRHDATADHRLVIALNIETTERMWRAVTDPERIEAGIRYAASVAAYAIGSGIPAGWLCNGWTLGDAKMPTRIEPRGGTPQLTALLEAMAKLQLESAASFAALLEEEAERSGGPADYLLITCHRDDKLQAAAERLRQAGHGVEWMFIPETSASAEAPASADRSTDGSAVTAREPAKASGKELRHA